MSLDKLLPKLLKAQSEFPAIPKNGYNPHFKSKFILLDDVLRLCLPVLRQNELVVTQTIAIDPGGNNKLVTTLWHISGQSIESGMSLINKAGTDQGLGSSISYAKRYSLIAMLGLSDDDDDAEATKPVEKKTLATTQASKTSQPVVKKTEVASQVMAQMKSQDPITPRQIDLLREAREQAKLTQDDVKKIMMENFKLDDVRAMAEWQLKLLISLVKKKAKPPETKKV